MMGALVCLGRNEISLENFKQLLETDLDGFVPYVAAGSGLHLKELLFDNSLYNES
jgi:tRNA U38,U39,U40 pseudouridine synthase TruA